MNRETWKKLTDEEKRIRVAELCGYQKHTPAEMLEGIGFDGIAENYITWYLTDEDEFLEIEEIPDYLNDLNAMHEAEKILSDDGDKYDKSTYMDWLENITDDWDWNTTASQRAEALVLALTGDKS